MSLRNLLIWIFILTTTLLFGCSIGSVPEKPADNSDSYDLIVVGGEPEGIAAAVSAARNGLKTLLIEDAPALGGLFTQGQLNFLDMNYGPDKELLTRGIFEEFYRDMGNAFDIAEAEQYFLRLVEREQNIALKLRTSFRGPLMDGNRITGVMVDENGVLKSYYGERVIDATADADVAAAAGAPFTVGAEDYGLKGRMMACTLVFRLKNVNWPMVFLYTNASRLLNRLNPSWGDPAAGATLKVAWGYGRKALEYEPQDKMIGFRGPNLARQKDGTVLVNALLVFGVDGLDPVAKARGIERAQKELPHIVAFMRERFPGFSRAELVGTAGRLYVRETRHIMGEYRLTVTDVLENRDHWDRIAHGSYPVDIQPAGPGDLGNVIGKPDIYSIPFRSIVPLKVDNLLVVGRSASYDSLAAGSARVVPVGMAVGEAAGVAAACSIERSIGFREMSRTKEAVREVQERLKKQGAYLVEYRPPRPAVMDHWAYPGVKAMRELGLAAGGYGNDYRLEEPIHCWDAEYMLGRVLERAGQLNPLASIKKVEFPENLNRRLLLAGLGEALAGEKVSFEEAVKVLTDKGVLTGDMKKRMNELDKPATFGELYVLLAGVLEAAARG
ncbi:MAG: FAD-dependent oxidoreductase [Peptococcaceae bacterium]|nr:FAD-dependent oxidoreductase [Peptococcaceae bacterium]MDH7525990.1 FAD-dependent oxidoreductase [Peptococcaceae bacterium]